MKFDTLLRDDSMMDFRAFLVNLSLSVFAMASNFSFHRWATELCDRKYANIYTLFDYLELIIQTNS